MSLANSIKAINQKAKAVHGADLCIMVARCIAFGHTDNLVIVMGKNHRAAAADFVRVTPGAKVTEESHPETDYGDGDISPAYTTSLVSF